MTRAFSPVWSPFPRMQTAVMQSREFEVFLGGAKGAAKSDVILMGALGQMNKERYKALITRETGPQLAELIRRSHQYFPRLSSRPSWNGDGQGKWTFPGGNALVFESIATPEDVEKIQGQEWAYVGEDEVANRPEERTVDLVQAEIRCPNPNVVRMWRGSGNPGKSGHAWVKRRFITPCGISGERVVRRHVRLPNGVTAILTRRFIPGTVFDNPIYANDPLYMAQLASLPEVLRRQLLYGDWEAGTGAALDELDPAVHVIQPFDVPDYWTMLGGYDYGYAHWWVWVVLAVDEDGRIFVIDTARGRRQKPHQMAERIERRLGRWVRRASYTITLSDTYAFRSKKELSDSTPTIAQILGDDHDLIISHGPTDRKAGLLNLRYYLAWRGIGPNGEDGEPYLFFFDTPGNRWLVDQLQSIVTDEADPEDALKVDCDTDTGVGGDDGYDALRVAVASRPQRAIGEFIRKGPVSAFSAATLKFMHDKLYKDGPLPEPQGLEGGTVFTEYMGT